jgi:hypothetical protein
MCGLCEGSHILTVALQLDIGDGDKGATADVNPKVGVHNADVCGAVFVRRGHTVNACMQPTGCSLISRKLRVLLAPPGSSWLCQHNYHTHR